MSTDQEQLSWEPEPTYTGEKANREILQDAEKHIGKHCTIHTRTKKGTGMYEDFIISGVDHEQLMIHIKKYPAGTPISVRVYIISKIDYY